MARVGSGLDARIIVPRSSVFSVDVEICVPSGTTVALLGPNGAGKSTIFAALAGLLPLDSGHIVLDGRRLDEPATSAFVFPKDRKLGVVFQDHLLFEHLNALDNVAFGPSQRGQGRREARLRAKDFMRALDLEALAGKRPSELSGGEAQRVALARALATDPDLLLLDEPLASMDVATRTALRRVMSHWMDSFSGPRLMVTHEPADAFLLASLIYVIEGGRVVQRGTPAEIRSQPATQYVAAVAGTNLLTGAVARGSIELDEGDLGLRTSDTSTEGAVLVTIHPRAISLHPSRPTGSPRNSWPAVVSHIEPLGDITRVQLGQPLPVVVDVTPGSVEELGLEVGATIWAAVKATEVAVVPR